MHVISLLLSQDLQPSYLSANDVSRKNSCIWWYSIAHRLILSGRFRWRISGGTHVMRSSVIFRSLISFSFSARLMETVKLFL